MTAVDSGTQLSGDVADYGFGPLLGRLASDRATGHLEITGSSGGTVEFCDGRISFASSPASLDRRCIAESIADIDDETWANAESTDDPLGALISQADLDAVMVGLVVEEVLLDALLDLELAGSTHFEFTSAVVTPATISFDASPLIEQLDERAEIWREAVATLGSTSDVVRIAPNACLDRPQVVIDAVDWALLSAIDGPTTLASVISRSGQSTYRSVLGLHRLLSMGALVRVEDAGV